VSLARFAGLAWSGANLPGYWSYRAALRDPRAAQERLLGAYLRDNAETAFGRAHGFSDIRSVEEYQDRVPLAGDADYAPWIDRIANGEAAVLTRAPVHVLQSTGGSTRAKLVPYTATLQRELRRAVAPWIVDLCRRYPAVARGRSYWAISPIGSAGTVTSGGIRVGFEEDADYLGGPWRWLVDASLAVPGAVSLATDIDSFRYLTLLFLLAADDLALISVWHPSFLTLLLEALPRHWDALLSGLRTGVPCVPRPVTAEVLAVVGQWARPRPRRAAELAALGPHRVDRLWPRLALVSCWGDGHAALHVPELHRLFPGVPVQPKGLLATEGCVTIPFEATSPLAVGSHFFEFLEDDGQPRLAHELQPNSVYSIVLTTGGGLYRYRLEDRVVCTGHLRATPTLRFLGKQGHVSDLCGEKLDERFVAEALAELFRSVGLAPRFALLAPDDDGRRPGYTLYLESAGGVPDELAAALEAALSGHGDYRYAAALGQLHPARIFRIASDGLAAYLRRCQEHGQRLGDIKPLALSSRSGWSRVFSGRSPVRSSARSEHAEEGVP
jgi:hypothetical protein